MTAAHAESCRRAALPCDAARSASVAGLKGLCASTGRKLVKCVGKEEPVAEMLVGRGRSGKGNIICVLLLYLLLCI